MKPLTSIFSSRVFIAAIAILVLAVSIFNFIMQEKEAAYLHDEMRILAFQREKVDKDVQALSQKLNSALQEVKNISNDGRYIKEEIESVKGEINDIRFRLSDISKWQRQAEERIQTPGTVKRLREFPEPVGVVYEPPLRGTLETQNISEHFQKAVFYQKNGELSKALQEYEHILETNPLNAEVYNNVGLIYQQNGDDTKALNAYRRAISLNPDYNNTHSNMGTVLYKQGRLEEASTKFKLVLEKEPENVGALTNLAIIHRREGELKEAEDLLSKAVNINEKSAEAHYNLALVLEEAGRTDDAIVHYRTFLKYSNNAHHSLTSAVLNHLEALEKK